MRVNSSFIFHRIRNTILSSPMNVISNKLYGKFLLPWKRCPDGIHYIQHTRFVLQRVRVLVSISNSSNANIRWIITIGQPLKILHSLTMCPGEL